MTEAFKGRIRMIGTSAGILIPKDKLNEAEVCVGDIVELAILPHKKDLSGFGIAKKFTKPFFRDKKVRNL